MKAKMQPRHLNAEWFATHRDYCTAWGWMILDKLNLVKCARAKSSILRIGKQTRNIRHQKRTRYTIAYIRLKRLADDHAVGLVYFE